MLLINNIYMLLKSSSHAPNIHLSKFTPVCKMILFANQHVSKFKVRSHGFYHQECFCVEIISGLKPVQLSFLYLQNKKICIWADPGVY